MKIRSLVSLAILGASLVATDARGAVVGLFDYAFNIDGVVTANPAVPAAVDDSAFSYLTGLGTISLSLATPGNHFVGLFVDHEIDEALNTFFNEYGSSVGVAPAGLSWEIDEPGFIFGDIYTNFTGSTAAVSGLDHTTGVPIGNPDDPSMALGWNFGLLVGENATITFSLSTVAPASGFYLAQTDPASNASVYFSSTLTILGSDPGGGGTPIPEPGSALAGLACLGVMGASLTRRRRRLDESSLSSRAAASTLLD